MTIHQLYRIVLFLVISALIQFVAQTVQAQDDDVETPDYTIVATWGQDGDVQFMGPNAIAIDAEDNIYVTEFMGNRVQKFNTDGELITTWGSAGNADGQFRNPTGIAIDSEDNIYVSESGNHRVQKFTGDGEWLTTWGEQGSNNGQFLSAMVITIVVINGEERVYVSDWSNNRIQVFDTDGEFLMSWGERGSEPGQLMTPTGVTSDRDGNIWVVDRGNSRVQSFIPDGDHLSTWGSEGSNNGEFLTPTSIAIDADGFIYVSEANGTRVQILTAEGDYLATPMNSLNSPHGIAFDSTGAMYIADTMNGQVMKLDRNTNESELASENTESTNAMLLALPQRMGPPTRTTGSVPHQQIGVQPVPRLNASLHLRVSSLPNVEMQNSIASLPGATGVWLEEGTFIAQPQAILAGREFTHIHPDGSLHAPLPLARALEAVEMGWAERHPWAEQREGWDGLVMLFTPQTDAELEIIFQLTVESYNFVTGQTEVATDYTSP